MPTLSEPVELVSECFHHLMRTHFTQIRPFWSGAETSGPTQLVKTSDFDQHWKVIFHPTGSYADEFGRRVAVRKRVNDENEANDVHWAAHNAAKFWLSKSMIAQIGLDIYGRDEVSRFLIHHTVLTAIQESHSKEFGELVLQEITQRGVPAGTRTNVITPLNPYSYPALLSDDPSAIRLVVLLPATETHAPIACILCNSALSKSETHQYEALSYVWGDPSKQRSITVSDQQFQATNNLESALRNLRYRDRHRVLWIDSICINQNDVAERNKQVQQMDSIYKRAQSVIIWLGPESDTSNNAFDLLQTCSGTVSTPHLDRHPDRLRAATEAIEHLIGRTWFTRIWCIQEFILGKRVIFQCGNRTAPWRNLVSVLQFFVGADVAEDYFKIIQSRPSTLRKSFASNTICRLVTRRQESLRKYDSVLSLLSDFREWASSDPRDRIFALYGLVPIQDPDRDGLKPDYSLKTSEVYIRFAVQYLRAHRDLDILSVATHPVKNFIDISSIRSLPCWVPDWRDIGEWGANFEYRPLAFMGQGTLIVSIDRMYDTTLGLKATSLDFQEDFQVLILDGIEVDTIEDIGALYMGYSSAPTYMFDMLSELKEIAGLSDEACYRYTGQPMREAFWRTLRADDAFHIPDSVDRRNLTNFVYRYRIPLTDAKLDWFPDFPPSVQDDLKGFQIATSHWAPIIGRRLFKTTKGLIGLAPATAKKGDSVVVLLGGKVPFVMRKFSKRHHLIGESYVHGIMDGEVVHQPRTEEFQELRVEKFLLA